MKTLLYYILKIISRLKREKNQETLLRFFRKEGISLGEDTRIYSNIVTSEPHLIQIGSNTTVSVDVKFVTHDNSISKVLPDASDLFGRIRIGDNCFIGESSVIMYGVTLADNIIVAAGSVVTRSFDESNVIIGGNPARRISTWESFAEKSRPYTWNLRKISREEEVRLQNEGVKLIERVAKNERTE